MILTLIFITTFLIQLVITTEMNIIAPLAPFLSQYFNIKDSSVILFNLGFSIVGLLIPILGAFSDKYGKKKSLMISLVFYIIGTFISGFSKNSIGFALGRIFIGIGYFSLSGTNLSYLSEFIPYESRGKTTGILRIAFGLAILFSPLYATNLINKYNNLTSIYLPLGIIGTICLFLMIKLPETEKNKEVKIDIKELISILKEPINYKTLLIGFLVLTAPSLLFAFLGIYLSNSYNLNQVNIGYVYTIIAIGTIFGIVFATLFTDKIGKEKLSRISYIIVFITLIAMMFIKSLPGIIGIMTIFAMGLDGGWTAYQALCSEINPKKRGTYMSLLYTTNAITITFYSILGPVFYNFCGYKFLIIISLISNFIALRLLYSMPVEEIIANSN